MQHPDSLIRSIFNGPAQTAGMQDGDAIGLDLFRKYIRRSWRVGLLWVVGFLSAGVAFSVFAPSYYTATTTLLINEPTMRPANENGPIIPDPAFVESQIQVLQSNEVFDRVLARARQGKFGNLAESSIRFSLRRWASSWGLVETNPETVRTQALIAVLKRGLLVRRVGTSNAVEIAFTARDPRVVANVADAFAREYLASEMELKQATREEVLEFFRNRLDELQNRAFAADPQDGVTTQGAQNGSEARAKWRETQSTKETYRDLYNTTLQRQYAQSVEQITLRARVITPAEPPTSRSWPRTLAVIGFAATAGLIFGAGHTIWRFATDDVLRSADDFLKVSGLRPTECVPLLSSRKWSRRKDSSGRLQAAYLQSSPQVTNAMDRLAIRLGASGQVPCPAIVAAVSPGSGAGTSTLAAHLALALSAAGRTLLLDANWRSVPAHGASGCVTHLDCIEAKLGDGDRTADVLSLRAKGVLPEANASQSLRHHLHESAPKYEWVVLDLNPMNCSADLDALMPEIAFVVLVISAGETTLAALDRAADVIPYGKKVSIVLNKASTPDAPTCA